MIAQHVLPFASVTESTIRERILKVLQEGHNVGVFARYRVHDPREDTEREILETLVIVVIAVLQSPRSERGY